MSDVIRPERFSVVPKSDEAAVQQTLDRAAKELRDSSQVLILAYMDDQIYCFSSTRDSGQRLLLLEDYKLNLLQGNFPDEDNV